MKSFFRMTLAVYVSFLAGCQCTSCFRGFLISARTQCSITERNCCPTTAPKTDAVPAVHDSEAARPQLEDAVSLRLLPAHYDRPQLEASPAPATDVSILQPQVAEVPVTEPASDEQEALLSSRVRRTSGQVNVPTAAAAPQDLESQFPSDVSVETPYQVPVLQANPAPRVAELPTKVEITSVDPEFGVPQTGEIAFSELPRLPDTPDLSLELESSAPDELQRPVDLVLEHPAASDMSSADATDHSGQTSGFAAAENDRLTSRLPTNQELQALADQQYYRQPEHMLRLRAVTPVGQHSLEPNQASILMRDTLFVGGRHLLETPAHWAGDNLGPESAPLQTQRQVREALQRLTPAAEALRR